MPRSLRNFLKSVCRSSWVATRSGYCWAIAIVAASPATVEAWREFVPEFLPMPHPSPRNQRWFKERPWFEADVVPGIQRSVAAGHWIED